MVARDDAAWRPGDTGSFVTLRAAAAFDDELFAVGDSGLLLRSSDGHIWMSEPSPTIEERFAITDGPTGLVTVDGVDTILFSTDGREWSVTGVRDDARAR